MFIAVFGGEVGVVLGVDSTRGGCPPGFSRGGGVGEVLRVIGAQGGVQNPWRSAPENSDQPLFIKMLVSAVERSTET